MAAVPSSTDEQGKQHHRLRTCDSSADAYGRAEEPALTSTDEGITGFVYRTIAKDVHGQSHAAVPTSTRCAVTKIGSTDRNLIDFLASIRSND